jgi:hypothetical protein
VSVSAQRRRRSPSLVRVIMTARFRRPMTTDIRERDTEGTASSFGDVPSHTPHAVPGLYGLVNEISRCRALSGSAFGSRYEGGATPPAVENVDPGLVDVRPLRGVAPPSQQSAV